MCEQDNTADAAGKAAPNKGNPTIESVHRDIALANQYRLELIKYLMAIAAALFAFTVTFRPSLARVDWGWGMWLGWFGLGASVIGGMFHMLGWDHYYKSYRDHDWGNPDRAQGKIKGKRARSVINKWRRFAMCFQFGGFVVGVACIGLFAAMNMDNVRKPEESTASTQPTVECQKAHPATPPATGENK